LSLGYKLPGGIDQHPLTIKRQPLRGQNRVAQSDALQRFDRVNVQAANGKHGKFQDEIKLFKQNDTVVQATN
jgi:hypothetical protein